MINSSNVDSVPFMDMQILAINIVDLINLVDEVPVSESRSIHLVAAHAIIELLDNPELSWILKKDDFVSDGRPLSRYLRGKNSKVEQIRGIDLLSRVILNEKSKKSHFFLGTNSDTLNRILTRVSKENPKLRIAGAYSPPFTDDWDKIVELSLNQVSKNMPDVIWVGLGVPKQLYVSSLLAEKLPGVFISVGAAFDFFAGNKREAPKLFKLLYLEWMYRLVSEPKRLFGRYFYGNLRFIALVLSDVSRSFGKR